MIEFKIIACPDKSQQATYQHVGHELVLGKSEGDMIVDDPTFGDVQLKITIEGDQATLENLNPEVEMRLNGKAVMDATPIREKDNVTIGRTTLNFSQLDLGPIPMPEPYENPSSNERFRAGTKEHALLEALQYLEDNVSSGAAPPPIPKIAGMPPKPPQPPIPPRVIPPPLPKKH